MSSERASTRNWQTLEKNRRKSGSENFTERYATEKKEHTHIENDHARERHMKSMRSRRGVKIAHAKKRWKWSSRAVESRRFSERSCERTFPLRTNSRRSKAWEGRSFFRWKMETRTTSFIKFFLWPHDRSAPRQKNAKAIYRAQKNKRFCMYLCIQCETRIEVMPTGLILFQILHKWRARSWTRR